MENDKKEVQELNMLEKAEQVAKRIEEANIRAEEILKRNEEVLSRSILSGRSNAGTTAPVPIDPEVQKKQDLKNYFKGSAIERLIK